MREVRPGERALRAEPVPRPGLQSALRVPGLRVAGAPRPGRRHPRQPGRPGPVRADLRLRLQLGSRARAEAEEAIFEPAGPGGRGRARPRGHRLRERARGVGGPAGARGHQRLPAAAGQGGAEARQGPEGALRRAVEDRLVGLARRAPRHAGSDSGDARQQRRRRGQLLGGEGPERGAVQAVGRHARLDSLVLPAMRRSEWAPRGSPARRCGARGGARRGRRRRTS
mmetsp:Transcript_74766/g.211281  ORF Transcript_74766/g.211281 Transcript_74766/m.211281 type:complete len:226 (+) Transcript_74766:558-1235(+)